MGCINSLLTESLITRNMTNMTEAQWLTRNDEAKRRLSEAVRLQVAMSMRIQEIIACRVDRRFHSLLRDRQEPDINERRKMAVRKLHEFYQAIEIKKVRECEATCQNMWYNCQFGDQILPFLAIRNVEAIAFAWTYIWLKYPTDSAYGINKINKIL